MDIGDKVVFKKSDPRVVVAYTVVGSLDDDKVQLEHPRFEYTTSWVDKEDLILWNQPTPSGEQG